MKWEAESLVDFKKSAGMGGWQPGTIAEAGARSYTVTDSRGGRHVVKPSHVRARREEPARRKATPLVGPMLWKKAIEAVAESYPAALPPSLRTISARDKSATMQAPIVSRPKRTPPKRSSAYLAHVRTLPCCACVHERDIEAHHYGPRGLGEKTSDFLTVPLCSPCHEEFHREGLIMCVGTLRIDTRELFYRTQARLLCEWLTKGDE